MKNLPLHKLTFVRSISQMRLNNIGADIYTGTNGKAYIVCDRLTHQIPYANIDFESLEKAEMWIEQFNGNNAGILSQIINKLLP